MKASNFRELNNEELEVKLTDLKKQLFNLRFNHALGQVTNPLLINSVKKDIARVKTVLREREQAQKA